MSVTLTDPSAQSRLAGSDRIGIGAHIAALAMLLAVVVGVTDGWFSADEVVMHQQSSLLVDDQRWTASPDASADAIDPDRQFALLARSDRIGSEIAPYTKHPMAPLLVAQGERLAGPRGRYLAGALAVLGASVLLSARFGWSRTAFWFFIVGTTAMFHTSVLWAHAPAFFFATAAAVMVFSSDGAPSGKEVALSSAAIAATATLRSEGLLLGAAFSLALFAVPMSKQRSARLLALGPVLTATVVYLGEPVVRTALFGSVNAPLVPPAASSNGLSTRLDVARIMMIEPSVAGGVGSFRLLGALLLVVASFGLARGRLGFGWTKVLLAVATICYLVGAFSGPIPGFLVAMPLVAAGAPWISGPSRNQKGALVAAGAFSMAVILTSYDSAGGGDWGARYLFVGVPLLAIVLLPAIERMVTDRRGCVVLAAVTICALSVQAGVFYQLLHRDATVTTVDNVAATIERGTSTDAGLVAAVSDERLSRFLYDRGVRGRVFHVPPGREDRFLELDELARFDRVMWVDLASVGDFRPGDLVETHGSVSIRTEVRR